MMKKKLSVLAMILLPIAAMADNEYVLYITREPESKQVVQVKNNKTSKKCCNKCKDKRVGKWYMGLNGDLSFYSGKYEQSNGGLIPDSSENFKFKPVLGLDLSVGYRSSPKWRFDGTLGYIGKYSETEFDQGYKTELDLETYYVTGNAYYDIVNGFYVGGGLGISFVNISVDDTTVSKESVTNVSPIVSGMLGWAHMLDDKVEFDIHYRLSLYDGGDISIGGAKLDTGLIINNTISAGIRYHF